MKQYDELFTKLKPNRTLLWKHHLGQVTLELELESKTLEMKVTPGQATVVLLFGNKTRWSLTEITLEAKITPSTARKIIAFWVGQGLMKEESPDVFILCEDGEGGRGGEGGSAGGGASTVAPPPLLSAMEDDAESAMAPSEVQRDEELQVLWSYILGMLTNLDSLPLERIYSMLKMFVEESVECSLEELRLLLDQKVMQHYLIMVNGQYKLNKS